MTNLKIEKMVYGGDGLARLADDSGKSKAVFVPFVLPGEEIEARITERGRGFSRAVAEKVLRPAGERIEAKCPYFLRCGGCHYQHAHFEHELQIKTQILRETLQRTAKFDWQQPIPTHSGEPWNYRNRTRMKVQQRGDGFAIGYYRFASHELLAVEECPISSPLINRTLAAVWKLGRTRAVPNEVAEIEFFVDGSDEQIMLELYLSSEVDTAELEGFARMLAGEVTGLAGITAFLGRSDRPAQTVWSHGASELVYRTAEDSYHVRAGSFFQVNRYLTEKLVGLVTGEESGGTVLDLYAGTGLFSLPLARRFKKVVAVESAPNSYADLRANAPENVDCRRSTTEDFLRTRLEPVPELIVVDPPRAGLGDKVTATLNKLRAARITYVSCDPATLARDLQALMLGGYKVQAVELIDLFPQTFHIETIVRLAR